MPTITKEPDYEKIVKQTQALNSKMLFMAMLDSSPEYQHDACAPKKGILPPSKPVSFAQ